MPPKRGGRATGSRASSTEPTERRRTLRSSQEPDEKLEKGLPPPKRAKRGVKKSPRSSPSHKSQSSQESINKPTRRATRSTRNQPQQPPIEEQPEEEQFLEEQDRLQKAEEQREQKAQKAQKSTPARKPKKIVAEVQEVTRSIKSDKKLSTTTTVSAQTTSENANPDVEHRLSDSQSPTRQTSNANDKPHDVINIESDDEEQHQKSQQIVASIEETDEAALENQENLPEAARDSIHDQEREGTPSKRSISSSPALSIPRHTPIPRSPNSIHDYAINSPMSEQLSTPDLIKSPSVHSSDSSPSVDPLFEERLTDPFLPTSRLQAHEAQTTLMENTKDSKGAKRKTSSLGSSSDHYLSDHIQKKVKYSDMATRTEDEGIEDSENKNFVVSKQDVSLNMPYEVIYTDRSTQTSVSDFLKETGTMEPGSSPQFDCTSPTLHDIYPPVDALAAFRGAKMLQERMRHSNQHSLSQCGRIWFHRTRSENMSDEEIISDRHLPNVARGMTDVEKTNFLVYQQSQIASIREDLAAARDEIARNQMSESVRDNQTSEIQSRSPSPINGPLSEVSQQPSRPSRKSSTKNKIQESSEKAIDSALPSNKLLKIIRSSSGKLVVQQDGRTLPRATKLLLESDEGSRTAGEQKEYYECFDQLSLADKQKIRETRSKRSNADRIIKNASLKHLPGKKGLFQENSFRSRMHLVTAEDVRNENESNQNGTSDLPNNSGTRSSDNTFLLTREDLSSRELSETPKNQGGWGFASIFGSVRRFLPGGPRTEPPRYAPSLVEFRSNEPVNNQVTRIEPSSPESPLASRVEASQNFRKTPTSPESYPDNQIDTGITSASFLPNRSIRGSRRNSTGATKPRRSTEERQKALQRAEAKKKEIEAQLQAAAKEEEELRQAIEAEEADHTVGNKRRRIERIDDLPSIPRSMSGGTFDLNSAYFEYSSDEDDFVAIDDEGNVKRASPPNKKVRFSSPGHATVDRHASQIETTRQDNSTAQQSAQTKRTPSFGDPRGATPYDGSVFSMPGGKDAGKGNVFTKVQNVKEAEAILAQTQQKKVEEFEKAIEFGQAHRVWVGPKSTGVSYNQDYNSSGSFAVPDNADSDSDSEGPPSPPKSQISDGFSKDEEELLQKWKSYKVPELEVGPHDDETDRLHKPQLKLHHFADTHKISRSKFESLVRRQDQVQAKLQQSTPKRQTNVFERSTQQTQTSSSFYTTTTPQTEPSALQRARLQADAHKPKNPSALSRMSNVNSPSTVNSSPSSVGSPMSGIILQGQQSPNQPAGFHGSSVTFGSLNAIAAGLHTSSSSFTTALPASTLAPGPSTSIETSTTSVEEAPSTQATKSTKEAANPSSRSSSPEDLDDPMVTRIGNHVFKWPGSKPWPLEISPEVQARVDELSARPEFLEMADREWATAWNNWVAKKAAKEATGEDL